MPAYKFTMLFQLATNIDFPNSVIRRIGGWSESWYSVLGSPTLVLNFAKDGPNPGSQQGMLYTRAALLPNGAGITGYRIQQVDPAGPVQTGFLQIPGDKSANADIPQMSLLYSVPAQGRTNIRRMFLRALPDSVVTEGEENFGGPGGYLGLLGKYFSSLAGWNFRGRDLSQAPIKVLTIDATGNVVTETPHGFAVPNMIRVLKTTVSPTNQVGGRFQVTGTGPTTTAFQISGWTFGATKGGLVRLDSAAIYPAVDAPNIARSRVQTRRVGRPFIQYRGRKSKRKR